MKNLDLIAAKAAQEIVANTQTYTLTEKGKEVEKTIEGGEVDNLATKALGVLQENGVYAVQLYLYSRTGEAERSIAKQMREKLLALFREFNLPDLENTKAEVALAFLTDHVCANFDTLLIVKQLWEQTLIYTRYGAKAHSPAEKVKP
jgi:hypothetical protein